MSNSKLVINQFEGVYLKLEVNKDDSFKPVTLVFYDDAEKTIPSDITGNTYEAPIFLNWAEKGQLATEIISPNKLKITYGVNTLPKADYYYHVKKTNSPDIEVILYGDLTYLKK